MALRTRTKVLIGVAAAVVVVGAAGAIAGPVVYARIVNASAADAPTLSTAPRSPASSGTAASTATPVPADGTWTAGDGSFAGYRVHEVLRGQDVTVVGRTTDVDASVDVEGGALRDGTVTVRVASIRTPESARDAYFRSTAMQTDRFPTATFRLTEPADVGAALAGSASDVDLHGDLTLHGVTKPVTVQAQVGAPADGHVQVVGSIPITFQDYGVRAPSLGFVRVDDHGAVEFSLELGR